MAWQSSLVIMVRQLVNDTGATEEYTDATIEEAIAVGAMIAINDISFSADYVIDLDDPDITPDPTDSSTYDPLAIALFSLKAACILDSGKVRTNAGNEGIIVRDGDTVVDTKGLGGKGYTLLMKEGPCGTYAKLIDANCWKNVSGRGVGVFGPYGNDSTDNSFSYYGGSARTFFDYYLRDWR